MDRRMGGLTYASDRQRQVWRVLPELVRARELLRDLVWKDLRARYRYAVMGFMWAVIEPLIPKKQAKRGRPRNDKQCTLNGILYVLKKGCACERCRVSTVQTAYVGDS